MTPQQEAAMRMALGDMQAGRVGDAMKNLRQALQQQEGRDWSLLEATQESLREHMGEIKRLSALVRAQQITIEKLEAQQQEPVAWIPIEQMYPQAKAIDILMGDGSILCAVLPQFDGDLWWDGSGTGEKFIDPKYANVTHWRIHDERTSPPASKPWVGLTDDEANEIVGEFDYRYDVARAIEAKLREKNT